VIRLTRDRKEIAVAASGLDVRCGSTVIQGYDDLRRVQIGADGSVDATQSLPGIGQSVGHGMKMTSASHSLTGAFNRGQSSFTGAWRLEMVFTGPGGQTVSCDSGRVRVRALL
jgi:hypothetical protein